MKDAAQSLVASGLDSLVIVAGDHAPPFGTSSNRAVFVGGVVPVFIMTPPERPEAVGAN